MRSLLNLTPWNPRPFFQVAPGWKPYLFCNNMAPHWRGVTLAGEKTDLCGVYVIPPHEGRRVPADLELVRELGYRDQTAWLRFMGAPAPYPSREVQKPAVLLDNPERPASRLKIFHL
jgi:hypothetical protein